jgi:hypothetical protein
MGAWERIKRGTGLQPSPNFPYFRVDFLIREFRKIIAFKVDEGFGYFLRYVTMAYYDHINLEESLSPLSAPFIEFYVERMGRQTAAYTPELISSPCASIPQIQPGTAPFTLKALSPASHKYLNYFYPFGDTVEVHLSRGADDIDSYGFIPGTTIVQSVFLVFVGYNCPEPRSRIW